ncbi:hypothetical protein MKW92_007766 [Papaver armeniacum]|nr:hypothetical protein MKW92_007766 [Papaver armeniacum]
MHHVGIHYASLIAPTRMHYACRHPFCSSHCIMESVPVDTANVLPDESHAKKARQAQDMDPFGWNSGQQFRKFTLTGLLWDIITYKQVGSEDMKPTKENDDEE